MNDSPSTNARKQKEVQQLLSRVPFVSGACELDLLIFFYRHPRSIQFLPRAVDGVQAFRGAASPGGSPDGGRV